MCLVAGVDSIFSSASVLEMMLKMRILNADFQSGQALKIDAVQSFDLNLAL